MARRTDLHRFFGDVDVGQLFELVVHAGEFLLDFFGRAARRDIEEDAAMWRAAPLADFAADGTGDHVASEQLRRTACVGSAAGNDGLDPAGRLFLSLREFTAIHFW